MRRLLERRSRRAYATAAFALASTLVLAGCSTGRPTTRTAWSTDWRRDSLILATSDGRRPVLWGVDPVAETVEPLAQLPAGGDPRLDGYAQVVPLGGAAALVTVPAAQALHQTAYVVDRSRATVTRRADLAGALDLARVGGGYVGVRAAAESSSLVRFDAGLRAVGTAPLPFPPAYAAIDSARRLCFVTSGEGRIRVAGVDPSTGRVRASGGVAEGDVSAVACGGGRTYVGVVPADSPADRAGDGGGGTSPVLRPAAWSAGTVLVSVPGGQVQSLAVDATTGHVIVGAAVAGGHLLAELDAHSGRVLRRVPLPGVEAMTRVVATPTSFVVLAGDRVAFVARVSGAVRVRALSSPLLAMNTMAY